MIERLFLKKLLDKIPVLSNVYVLLVVALGWVIFRFMDLELGMALAKSLFGLNGNPVSTFLTVNTLKSNMFLLGVCVMVCLPWAKRLRIAMEIRVIKAGRAAAVAWGILFYSVIPVILLLMSTASLVGDSYNPFIYFQF